MPPCVLLSKLTAGARKRPDNPSFLPSNYSQIVQVYPSHKSCWFTSNKGYLFISSSWLLRTSAWKPDFFNNGSSSLINSIAALCLSAKVF